MKKRRACEIAAVIVSVVGLVIVFVVGSIAGTDWVRQQAIDAGAARWVVDAKTGTTTFKFCCKCEDGK